MAFGYAGHLGFILPGYCSDTYDTHAFILWWGILCRLCNDNICPWYAGWRPDFK